MARKPDPKSKAGFVRSQPTSLSAAGVVSKAKAAGIKLDERYVYSVRTTMNRKAKGKAAPVRAMGNGLSGIGNESSGGSLQAEIERIVEAKVTALLKERLGALFSG